MALKGRRYNNAVGGGCSSLGRYKIGAKYYGNFGLAYMLHGLDTSNSNPLKRYVFLHSHDCVPKTPVHPYPFCQSDGCPSVAPAFRETLAGYIDTALQPILLEIFDNNFSAQIIQ